VQTRGLRDNNKIKSTNQGARMFKSESFSIWGARFIFALLALFAPLAAVAAPHIDNFGVDQVSSLDAGTELDFTLEGTPKARASLRITGVQRTVMLQETDPGYYEGTYTIRKKDRIPANAVVVATLSQGKRRHVARLGESLLDGSVQVTQPPVSAQPQIPVQPAGVSIERFTGDQVERFEPGTELKFTMTGTPRGRAFFTIENIVTNRAMEEVRAGLYEGRYTIRRQDNFTPGMPVTGTLQANGQTARAQLDQRLVNDSEPPGVTNVSPRDNENVPNSNSVTVGGSFDDRGTGVDPKSVKILFDGKDVTALSTITLQNFSFRPTNLAAGNHAVEVRARDQAGNASRTNWSFRTGNAESAPMSGFPLDIVSPRNNADVASGPIEVRGRTVPNASIDVEVIGSIFGLTQRIFENSLRADGQGYFSFTFQPPLRVSGARYEVTVRATRDKETRERKLVLTQQR
jgi:hypothetical protein